LRQSQIFGALLDGVNVASLALMAGVLITLGQNALIDWLTILLALIAAVSLLRFKVNSTWLIIGGGIIGTVYKFFVS
jgi:chromate transporter